MRDTTKRRRIGEVEAEIERSSECRVSAGGVPVFGSGNLDSDVIIMGEGPGAEEEARRRPFVGAAGKLLRNALSSLGFEPDDDFFFLNIVFYRPFRRTQSGRKENRPPTRRQIEGCRAFVKRHLEILEPRLVLALGANAARWFLGRDFQISRDHGKVFRWRNTDVLPTFHPGAALRPFGPEGAKRRREFHEDLERFARLVKESRGEHKIPA